MKLLRIALCGLMLGCPSEPTQPTVRVDLKTDYVPFVEFDAVRMEVGDNDLAFRIDRVVDGGENYLRGQRINETMVQRGEHPITITLFHTGAVVATRRVSAIVQANITVVTVVLTRSCEAVMCPNDNPALESCLGGRCVDPRCTPETPEFCPAAQCEAPTECAMPDNACVESRCDLGVCLAVPNNALCDDGEVCHGLRGCIVGDVRRDAGPSDGGMIDVQMFDAGSRDAGPLDAGTTDSGAPDVFDGGTPDVFDAGPPPPGACDAPDDDTIFLFSFDDASDVVSGENGVAESSVLEAGDSPCGGNILRITSAENPSSHFRVGDRPTFDLDTGSIDFYAKIPSMAAAFDIIGRDASGIGNGHLSVSTSEESEIVIRSQIVGEEFYTCSNPIEFGAMWHRIGINFGVGGIELWIDGVRHMRGGSLMYQTGTAVCDTGSHELGLAGNDNPFVAGAVQIFTAEGSHLPLRDPFAGLELDQLRLSSVRRDYENEIRP